MNGLGFGLEKIGILALARPLIFSLLLAAVTLVSLIFLPSVKFNGSVTAVIPRTSENFLNFERQKEDFRNFSRDVAIVVRSPRLKTASGLEDLRNMQLELAIADGVTTALTVFSLPDVDEETGELQQFFPNVIENDAQAQALLKRMLEEYPQAHSLISTEANSALLLVALDLANDAGNDARAFEVFESLVKEVEAVVPDDFELFYGGLTPIGITILDTLIKDQVRLTLLGLLFGAVVAMMFFRCVASAILCAIPPMLTAIWSIGFFGFAGVPITYLTTILPTLALILAYADGIVLHHRWQQLNSTNEMAKLGNLREAVMRVGPASALTSLTTAVAISSFALSSSEALFEFAWLGVILVSFAFLTVIIALPVVGLWFARMNLFRSVATLKPRIQFGSIAVHAFSARPSLISGLSLLLIIPLAYSHFNLLPDYRVTDYLPKDSNTLEAERIVNEEFSGRSLIFFSIPVVEQGGLLSVANRDRLAEVTELLEIEYGHPRVFSLHAMWRSFDQSKIELIARKLEEASPEVRQGYLSKNGDRMLVSLRVSSGQSISEGSALVEKLDSELAKLDYAKDIIITGFPVLLASEFTSIINELRTSLLIAVFVGICLIGLATRSLFYAMAAATPNLFPILLVEALIFVKSGNISVTEVVALTLAFGIAIDNAVHVINVLEQEKASGKKRNEALKSAILEVAPALGGSTLIICTATTVILTSSLPILPAIGQLIIAILIVALVTNLILLPSNIHTLGRMFDRGN
ncbi:MAG: efflux RND transporter permease subunit [Rhizobiaceae bacterium]